MSVDRLETTLQALRRELDGAFVDPPGERLVVEDFLSLRLGLSTFSTPFRGAPIREPPERSLIQALTASESQFHSGDPETP